MGKEYRAKIFKSGNSVALRLPKALGLQPGDEMTLREQANGYELSPAIAVPKRIDLTGIAGSIPGLKPLSREERDFAERELDWTGRLLRNG